MGGKDPMENGPGRKACDDLAQAALDALREVYGPSLVSVVLFGSYARGEQAPSSDLDILVVLDKAPTSRWKRCERLPDVMRAYRASDAFRGAVEAGFLPEMLPVILSREEASETRPLYLDASEDGILLLDDGTMAGVFAAVRRRLKELGSVRLMSREGRRYWDLKPDLKVGEVFEI